MQRDGIISDGHINGAARYINYSYKAIGYVINRKDFVQLHSINFQIRFMPQWLGKLGGGRRAISRRC